MSNAIYFEYKIKNGDTLSKIIYHMYGRVRGSQQYTERVNHLLALNPHISNPDRIRAGDMLRLGIIPRRTTPRSRTGRAGPIKRPIFITESLERQATANFWALAWLEHNTHYLTIPGAIATGAAGSLLSPGNVSLINEVSDGYADYKSGNITKAQYNYQRKKALDLLKKNIGPMEKLLFGRHATTHQSIRIARAGGIPATARITRHAARLKSLARRSRAGGIVLAGVGLTAACMQIASTTDTKEKNEIFVETITSTAAGGILGSIVGLFLVSNPIGWGTAIVLAVGSTAASYLSGKGARFLYGRYGEIDLVAGTGVDRICK